MKKYDSFKYNNRIVNLSDALTNNKKQLLPFYNRKQLFCPECGIAKLKFTPGTSKRDAFLSTKQPSDQNHNLHAKGCSFSYERIAINNKDQFYTELTENQIKDKVNGVLDSYLNKNTHFGENDEIIINNDDEDAISLKGKRHTNKRLPRYKIESFYKTPEYAYNVPVLYHGIVKLSCKKIEKDGVTKHFGGIPNN